MFPNPRRHKAEGGEFLILYNAPFSVRLIFDKRYVTINPLIEGGEIMVDYFKRISVNRDICHGKPCITGHRIMVYQLIDLVASGLTFDEIIHDYFPQITKKDIEACLLYANAIIKNEDIYYYEDARKS